MNHLGDTNKMVSDTPRMNAARNAAMEHMTGDVWRVGCQLERELNAANAEIEEKRKDVVWLATEKAKLENYVMRLEDCAETAWGVIANVSGGNWAEQRVDWREAAIRWRDERFKPEFADRKAKEAKP